MRRRPAIRLGGGPSSYTAVMDFVHIRGPAEYLLDEVIGVLPLVLLRLDGDSDDTHFWHAIDIAHDLFAKGRTYAIRVVFDDGTPEKVFAANDEVEFAVPRL
jgi:hypothetical protein